MKSTVLELFFQLLSLPSFIYIYPLPQSSSAEISGISLQLWPGVTDFFPFLVCTHMHFCLCAQKCVSVLIVIGWTSLSEGTGQSPDLWYPPWFLWQGLLMAWPETPQTYSPDQSPRELLGSASQYYNYKCDTTLEFFFWEFWGFNSGLHICIASNLLTELAPHPFEYFLMKTFN